LPGFGKHGIRSEGRNFARPRLARKKRSRNLGHPANSSGSFNLGIYASNGTLLIDSGSITCSSGVKNVLKSVTLQPGTYYYAFAATDTVCALFGYPNPGGVENIGNANATSSVARFATAGNLFGGALPSPLGTLTTSTFGVPVAMAEP